MSDDQDGHFELTGLTAREVFAIVVALEFVADNEDETFPGFGDALVKVQALATKLRALGYQPLSETSIQSQMRIDGEGPWAYDEDEDEDDTTTNQEDALAITMPSLFNPSDTDFNDDELEVLNAAARSLADDFDANSDDESTRNEGRKSLADALNNAWLVGCTTQELIDAVRKTF